jgi:hypothetical protein
MKKIFKNKAIQFWLFAGLGIFLVVYVINEQVETQQYI